MLSKNTKIGWIGTGVMGSHMASYLIKHGYTNLYVFNRTASKANNLVTMGASYLDSPQAVAREVDVLFLMLGFPHDVRNIVFDPTSGILNHLRPNSYLVDHTTSSPGLAVELFNALKEKNVESVDAPVSGGEIGAINGKLVTMIGGTQTAFQTLQPLINCYS